MSKSASGILLLFASDESLTNEFCLRFKSPSQPRTATKQHTPTP